MDTDRPSSNQLGPEDEAARVRRERDADEVTIHVPQAVVRVGSQGSLLKSLVSASMAGMSCLRVVER